MCNHYVIMNIWNENVWTIPTICSSHTHEIFNIYIYISYKDLIFDKWKKNKHRFENFTTKAFTKI
jgi:hypothetical protein